MKKILITILITMLSCGGGGGGADAQPCGAKECPVKIHMVHIEGFKSFDFLTAEEMVRNAINFLNQNTTIQVEYASGVSIADPLPETGNVKDFGTKDERFIILRNYFIDNRSIGGDFRKRELTVVVDKPLFDDDNVAWTAGRAHICALYAKYSLAVSYVTPFTNPNPEAISFNRTFEEMFNRGSNIIAHEIGHNLGADHESATCQLCIMNGTSRGNIHDDIMNFLVSGNSLNDIERCIRRETRAQLLRCESRTLFNIKQRKRCKKRFDIKKIRKRDVAYRGTFEASPLLKNDIIGEIFLN